MFLDPYWVDHCSKWQAPINNKYTSRGAGSNGELQANGKRAECALALLLHLNPEDSVNWTRGGDWDLDYRGLLIDVKFTPKGSYLIWPLEKLDKFDDANFHALALMIGDRDSWEFGGWCTKRFFCDNARRAGKGHPLTKSRHDNVGTPCLHRDKLGEFESLRTMRVERLR